MSDFDVSEAVGELENMVNAAWDAGYAKGVDWAKKCGGGIDAMTDAELAEHGLVRKDKEHIISHATVEVTPHMQFTDEQQRFIDEHYQLLPVDAEGKPIRIGDVMEWCDSGETLTVEGIGRDVLFYIDGENAEWTAARNKRHHHEPTVEDVLREFTDEVWNRCCEGATASDSGIDELVAECAAKLRLADIGVNDEA